MSAISSILLYIVVFGLSAFIIQFGYKRKNKMLQGIGLLFPILLGGLRYDVGLDYMSYFYAYADVVNPQSTLRYEGVSGLEATFRFIAHVSDLLTSGPVLLFTIYCAITVLAFYAAMRVMAPKNVGFAMFFFYAVFFLNSFNIMRQGAAMSIGALAIAHYANGRRRRGIAYVLVASLLHVSALLILGYMLAVHLMDRRYLVKKKIMRFSRLFSKTFILSLAVIVAGVSVTAVGEYIYSATGRIGTFDAQVSVGVVFKYLLTVAVLFVAIYAWRHFSVSSKRFALFVALGLVFYSLGIVHNEAARVGMYLLILTPILAALVLDSLPSIQLKGKIFTSFGVALLCSLYVVSVHIGGGDGVKYNYQTILTSDEYRRQIKGIDI